MEANSSATTSQTPNVKDQVAVFLMPAVWIFLSILLTYVMKRIYQCLRRQRTSNDVKLSDIAYQPSLVDPLPEDTLSQSSPLIATRAEDFVALAVEQLMGLFVEHISGQAKPRTGSRQTLLTLQFVLMLDSSNIKICLQTDAMRLRTQVESSLSLPTPDNVSAVLSHAWTISLFSLPQPLLLVNTLSGTYIRLSLDGASSAQFEHDNWITPIAPCKLYASTSLEHLASSLSHNYAQFGVNAD